MAETRDKISDKQKVIYLLSGIAILIAAYFLLRSKGAGSPAAVTQTTNGSQPGMFWPPTALSVPALPPTSVNVSFTPAQETNLPTGYVPLFGFIGFGGQWA